MHWRVCLPQGKNISVTCGPYHYTVEDTWDGNTKLFAPFQNLKKAFFARNALVSVNRDSVGIEIMPLATNPKHIASLLQNPKRCSLETTSVSI